MPPKKLTPNGKAAEPAGNKALAATKSKSKTAAKSTGTKRSSSSTMKYIRNVRGVQVRVTFDTGRKVVLTPRGQRNDMTAISKEELDDPIFLNNLGSLYEVISSKEADEIRQKQNTNASSASLRPEDILRTSLDEPSKFAGVEMSDAEKSVTIARLNEVEGRPNEDRATEIVPVRGGLEPARANVPGSEA